MRLFSVAFCAGLIAASLATTPCADATTVKHFDLGGMTASAARVFRGTVIDVRAGTVNVGGGQLATTIYRIRVTETFKGKFPTVKDITYAEVEMIGSVKADATAERRTPLLSSSATCLAWSAGRIICSSSPPRVASRSRARSAWRKVCFEIDTSIPSRADGQPDEQRRPGCGRSQGPAPLCRPRGTRAHDRRRRRKEESDEHLPANCARRIDRAALRSLPPPTPAVRWRTATTACRSSGPTAATTSCGIPTRATSATSRRPQADHVRRRLLRCSGKTSAARRSASSRAPTWRSTSTKPTSSPSSRPPPRRAERHRL